MAGGWGVGLVLGDGQWTLPVCRQKWSANAFPSARNPIQLSSGVPQPDPWHLAEVAVESDQDRAGLNGLGRQPDIIDRDGCAGSLQCILDLAVYLGRLSGQFERAHGGFG